MQEAIEKQVAGATFDFSWALKVLKNGLTVHRAGWNGKGMYLFLVPPMSNPSPTVIVFQQFGPSVPYGAYIGLKTAQGNVVPWTASQTDLLAEDWQVVIRDAEGKDSLPEKKTCRCPYGVHIAFRKIG
jgi:hypothetical protein